MNRFRIQPSDNPDLLIFETETPLVERAYAFNNVAEAQEVPLAQQLFYLPFVKAVTLNSTQLTLERFPIVEWNDVQNEVQEQLEKYLADGGEIVKEKKSAPASVYAESTPNPAVMKFVANKKLVDESLEFTSIDTTKSAPLAQALFTNKGANLLYNFLPSCNLILGNRNKIFVHIHLFYKRKME